MLVVAQQAAPRALVDAVFRHGDDGIDWCDEGRTKVAISFHTIVFQKVVLVETSRRHHQVAACRKAHHAHLVGVDMVIFGMFAHPFQGALGVRNHVGMAVSSENQTGMKDEGSHSCRAVAQHESRDAVALQPSGHLVAFAFLVKPIIASARADDDGHLSRVFFGDIRRKRHLSRLWILCVRPQGNRFLRYRMVSK